MYMYIVFHTLKEKMFFLFNCLIIFMFNIFRVFPILKPQEVAIETVKGIQCDEEFVYIPRSLNVSMKITA